MAATVGTAITMVFIVKVMMYIYSYVVGKWLMFNVLILVVWYTVCIPINLSIYLYTVYYK